jgi:hypothetical protein
VVSKVGRLQRFLDATAARETVSLVPLAAKREDDRRVRAALAMRAAAAGVWFAVLRKVGRRAEYDEPQVA